MLWKLSFTGLKSRFKDYAVLFSGLTLASAIFYMFMTIALNPAFLKGALKISFTITHFVFMFGIALLGLITLVYVRKYYVNAFISIRLNTFLRLILAFSPISALNLLNNAPEKTNLSRYWQGNFTRTSTSLDLDKAHIFLPSRLSNERDLFRLVSD